MRKQKIKVKGVVYRYTLSEDHAHIRLDGIVPYETSQLIKERLIRKGILKEVIDHEEVSDPKKRFEKWCNIELKLLAEDKHDPLSKAAKEELERRNS